MKSEKKISFSKKNGKYPSDLKKIIPTNSLTSHFNWSKDNEHRLS